MMGLKTKIFRVFLLYALFCLPLWVLSQSIFTGRVVDNQNKVIFSAVVLILDFNKNEIASSVSDTAGVFSITIPEHQDNFIFYISCYGYKSETMSLSEATKKTEFILEMNPIELPSVEIITSRPALIRETDRFVIPSVHTSPLAQGKTIVDFLKYAPLLNTSREGDLEILGKGKAIIYINGRKSSADLNSIPAENIEKVEIIAHPGSQYAASERGGIINVILHRPPEDGILVNIRVGDRQKEQWKLNSPSLSLFIDAQKGKFNITTGLSGSYLPLMINETSVYNYYIDSLDAYMHSKSYSENHNVSSFLNLDYHINKRHTIGFRLEGRVAHRSENSSTEIRYHRLGSDITDSSNLTQSALKQDNPNYRLHGNFNYNIIFNAKSKLSFDWDYNRYQTDLPRYFQYTKTIQTGEINNDFLTHSQTLIDGYSFKTDFKHNFTDDMKLGAGGSIYGAIVDNPYFYGNKINNEYVSDRLQTNHFVYKDITAAVYLNFDWDISDRWSFSAGIRGEYYAYKGIQKNTNEVITNQYPNIFPSFSLLYIPHDDHELSFDFSSNYFYPGYLQLNPFKIYYSPNLYIENNPYLKPAVEYTFDLSYILMSDYTFILSYEFSNRDFYTFTEPVGNGISREITKNIGKNHALYFSFSLNKYLCNKYWFVSFNADVDYFKAQATPSDIMVMNDSGIEFTFDLKNEIALCKNKDWKFSIFCYYWPSSKNITSTWGTIIDGDISISKIFKTSSLSFGVSNILDRPFKIFTNNTIYEYSRTLQRFYRTYWVSYTIGFGNNKTHGTTYRENKISNKMQ